MLERRNFDITPVAGQIAKDRLRCAQLFSSFGLADPKDILFSPFQESSEETLVGSFGFLGPQPAFERAGTIPQFAASSKSGRDAQIGAAVVLKRAKSPARSTVSEAIVEVLTT